MTASVKSVHLSWVHTESLERAVGHVIPLTDSRTSVWTTEAPDCHPSGLNKKKKEKASLDSISGTPAARSVQPPDIEPL